MNLPSTTVASNPMAFSSIARTSTSVASVRRRALWGRIARRVVSLVLREEWMKSKSSLSISRPDAPPTRSAAGERPVSGWSRRIASVPWRPRISTGSRGPSLCSVETISSSSRLSGSTIFSSKPAICARPRARPSGSASGSCSSARWDARPAGSRPHSASLNASTRTVPSVATCYCPKDLARCPRRTPRARAMQPAAPPRSASASATRI